MIHFPRWKVWMILGACLLGILYAAPNLIDRQTTETWQQDLPGWLPIHQLNLGLDLQGGSHLLLQVEVQDVVAKRLQSLIASLRTPLRQAGIGYVDLGVRGDQAGFTLRDPSQAEAARDIVTGLDSQMVVSVSDDGRVSAGFSDIERTRLLDSAMNQSIEIVRRRIDETGTREPLIQRQGNDRILVQLPGLDDPQRIKDLLGRTAQLTFQMVDDTVTQADIASGNIPPGTELLPMAEPGPNGQPIMVPVSKTISVSGDMLVDSQPTFSQNRPVVSFRFDSVGARRFGDTTRENVGKQFAIVLDNKVISAPRINEPILGGSGIIQGGFTVQGASDLALLLRAGALPAPLQIIEERTVGPGLGADSIRLGIMACIIGFVLVAGYMIAAYGFFGLLADVALVFNLIITIALMSLLHATLTLPGIAGLLLTLGLSVDANVLINERIREETRRGRSPLASIDVGFSRAYSTIIDSNLTTLLKMLILFWLGSGAVKGFAVTISLGIGTSMFTAILLVRLMMVSWLRRRRPVALPV